MAEPPTANEQLKFAKIERDACLPGVYDAQGKRIAAQLFFFLFGVIQ
jgi:hypothetical protein